MAVSLKAQQSSATREEIINASMRLFASQGFRGTSLAEIAGDAGITKGAIYWHFKNKEALFVAILDKIRQDWQRIVMQRVVEASDPRQKLNRLFDNYHELFNAQPEICLFLQRIQLGTDKKHAQRVSAVFDRTADFIADILLQGQGQGLFTQDLDAKLTARTVIASLAGATALCSANKQLRLLALIGEIKDQMLARVLKTS